MRSFVLIGGTGAVGSVVARTLAADPRVERLTLLGRRRLDGLPNRVVQHLVDPLSPAEVAPHLAGHEVALSTLGIGQPSKVPRTEFERVDRDGVLAFARACRAAGVRRFSSLSSVGADARSASWYLRVKGQLDDGLAALGFERTSLFRPSTILTPTNRFGPLQGLLQGLTPLASPLLFGRLRAYRGIEAEVLGRALAREPWTEGDGVRVYTWDALITLGAT